MSKRDDVLAEALEVDGIYDPWPVDRETGMSRADVDAFRTDMLLATRAALRIAELCHGGKGVAAVYADAALDERRAAWDGIHRKRPVEWREEYAQALGALAAIALDAVMSIDDQRVKDGRTFYETTEG